MSRHVLVLGLVILLVAGWVVTVRATSQLLPQGDLIAQVTSPTNDYRLCFYRNCAGGTTGKCAFVGVATNCKTGAARQFYFNYTEEDIAVSWTGPSTVRINAGPVLDVAKGVWDCRWPVPRPQ